VEKTNAKLTIRKKRKKKKKKSLPKLETLTRPGEG
jgi:hypothetical protein